MKTKKKRSSKVKLDNSTDLSKHFSPVSKGRPVERDAVRFETEIIC